MMKMISKFLFFAFSWLYVFTAISAYAQDAASSSGDVEILDAWEFMEKKSSQYSQFKDKFGKNQWSIECGPRTCYTKTQTCMIKSEYLSRWNGERSAAKNRTKKDLENAGQALSREGRWFGEGRNLLTYVCVPNEEVSSYQKNGFNIYDTNDNLEGRSSGDEREHNCFTAKSGDVKYCARIIGNTVEIRAAKGNSYGCEVIPVAWYNNRKCVFCSLMGGIFAAADNIAIVSQDALAYSFAIVIALGLLIWIAMKTVSFVSSMTKQDAAKYITELIKQSYKFVIVFAILSNYSAAFDYIIRPLLRSGLEFGQSFVSVQSVSQRFDKYYQENGPTDLSVLIENKDDEDFPKDYAKNIENQYFDFGTYVSMEHLAYNVNLNYSLLQTVGSSLICRGWRYTLGLSGEGLQFGLGLSCIIYGCMLSAFGFLLCMAFIFYLLDAVVQLGIVGGLLPFLIASWPFKITSKYTSTGFKMFLNSVFTFMMMGFVVKITILLIDNALGVAQVSADSDKTASGLMTLAKALDNQEIDTLRTMVNVFSIGFCILIFANIMGFLLLSKVAELTNKFSSGGMKGSASSIATMAASTVKGAASKVMAPTAKAIDKKAEEVTEKVSKTAGKAIGGLVTLRPLRKAIAKHKASSTKGARPSSATLGGSEGNSTPPSGAK